MQVVEQILGNLRQCLQAVSDTPALDAQVLLAHILNRKRTWVLAHPDAALTDAQQHALWVAVARLQTGEPLPYVLGHWEFYGRDFIVSPATLIPRPETELLVEKALKWLAGNPDRRYAVDVGVGSGCIAITLAVEVLDLRLVAVDLSWSALLVARQNAERQGVSQRVQLVQADLLTSLSGPFDLVCANLPYIPSATLTRLRVRHTEPQLALDGGNDGLGLIRRLLADIQCRLRPGGLVLLEIEARQGEAIRGLAQALLPGIQTEVFTDLAGHERLIACTVPG